MMTDPMKSSSSITVVKPPSAAPENFCTSAMMPNTTAQTRVTAPRIVTMWSGAEDYDEMLVRAYSLSDFVDHLLSPAVRSRTQ